VVGWKHLSIVDFSIAFRKSRVTFGPKSLDFQSTLTLFSKDQATLVVERQTMADCISELKQELPYFQHGKLGNIRLKMKRRRNNAQSMKSQIH
jgi:hypothetical protein